MFIPSFKMLRITFVREMTVVRETDAAVPPPRPLASIIHGGFPGEPSLFTELGILDTDVPKNLKIVLIRDSDLQPIDTSLLVGLLLFCGLALALLVTGKVRFSTVYVITFLGFIVLYVMFTSMAESGSGAISAMELFSVLSYCVVALVPAALAIPSLELTALGTTFVALPFIVWAAASATRCVMAYLACDEVRSLVFIPLFLFYACLMLLPIY
jgi:hypothetical protein